MTKLPFGVAPTGMTHGQALAAEAFSALIDARLAASVDSYGPGFAARQLLQELQTSGFGLLIPHDSSRAALAILGASCDPTTDGAEALLRSWQSAARARHDF